MPHHLTNSDGRPRRRAIFEVWGPFKVPPSTRGSKHVDDDRLGLRDFWEHVVGQSLGESKGCYVFAMRAGKGMTPVYVGRAIRQDFRRECFAFHKLWILTRALADYKRGTPLLFLVTRTKGKGKTNIKAIRDMEEFLIQNGRVRNPDLQNVKLTKEPSWGIAGDFGSPRGKPTSSAVKFRKLLGIQ